MVDLVFVNDEPAVLANGFDCIGGDPTVALGTLVSVRFCVDVLVEARFVDVSSSHRSHRVQEPAFTASPSLIKE